LKDATRRERFERALLPHLDAAYNLARWLTGSGHEAEDAVQEACLRALEYFEGFRGEDGRAWLLAIVRNTCYDRLRRTRPTEELLDAADSAAGPEALQLQAADRALVHRGMERLPAEYREALVLREMEGLSYREIARVAGVPVGTVMSRLARARAGLRAAIVKERQ
jgi:RNA polymerase sigma-70 factor (ECF subfamily)